MSHSISLKPRPRRGAFLLGHLRAGIMLRAESAAPRNLAADVTLSRLSTQGRADHEQASPSFRGLPRLPSNSLS